MEVRVVSGLPSNPVDTQVAIDKWLKETRAKENINFNIPNFIRELEGNLLVSIFGKQIDKLTPKLKSCKSAMALAKLDIGVTDIEPLERIIIEKISRIQQRDPMHLYQRVAKQLRDCASTGSADISEGFI